MSKYIKFDDAIDCECPLNEIWEDCSDCPLNDSETEPCKMGKWLKSLPTIEVSEEELKGCDKVDKRFSEERLSKLQASENSVENTTASEDFTSISRANSKLEVSEDCTSKAYLEQEIENQVMTVEKDKEYWRGWNNESVDSN